MSQGYSSWVRVQAFAAVFLLCISVSARAAVSGNAEKPTSDYDQEVDTSKYYYNQLSDFEKKIYQYFIDFKEPFLNNKSFSVTIDVYASGKTIDKQAYVLAVARARQAYICDDSEATIWYHNVRLSLKFYEDHVDLLVRPNSQNGQYADFGSQNVRCAIEDFEESADKFASTLSGTDAEKYEQIYDWLTTNVTYDRTHVQPNAYNAYGAFMNRQAICSGYAYAYKYIADRAGLKVLYVTGNIKVKGGNWSYHAWNLVYLDGEWLMVDATAGSNSDSPNPKQLYLLVPLNTKLYKLDLTYFTYP